MLHSKCRPLWIPLLTTIFASLAACDRDPFPTAPSPGKPGAARSGPTLSVRRIAFHTDRDGQPGEIYAMTGNGTGQVSLTKAAGGFLPSWSPDGKRIVFQRYVDDSPPGSPIHLFVMNADGTGVLNLTGALGLLTVQVAAWSPDASTIAFHVIDSDEGGTNIWLVRSDGSDLTPLTTDGLSNHVGGWSPGGSRIVYVRTASNPRSRTEDRGIYVINADGTGRTQLTMSSRHGAPTWSPDGTQIAFIRHTIGAEGDIYVMNADGSGKKNITKQPANYGPPMWSPDGNAIAFSSDRSGSHQIWLLESDGSQLDQLTTGGYNSGPVWSPDGAYLAFVRRPLADGDFNIWRVDAAGTGQVQLTALGRNVSPTWRGVK